MEITIDYYKLAMLLMDCLHKLPVDCRRTVLIIQIVFLVFQINI